MGIRRWFLGESKRRKAGLGKVGGLGGRDEGARFWFGEFWK